MHKGDTRNTFSQGGLFLPIQQKQSESSEFLQLCEVLPTFLLGLPDFMMRKLKHLHRA